MSAEKPTPSPPPLRLVLNADGSTASIGRADFAPSGDQRVIEVPDDRYAAFVAEADQLAPGEEIAYGEGAGAFARRARAKSPAEVAEEAERTGRATRLAKLDQDIAGFAALTAQERAAAQLNTMIIVRAVVRRLMGE